MSHEPLTLCAVAPCQRLAETGSVLCPKHRADWYAHLARRTAARRVGPKEGTPREVFEAWCLKAGRL